MTGALIGLGAVFLLNIIAFSFTYGKLVKSVSRLEDSVNNHLREDIKEIYQRIDNINERLSKIEGYLNREE